MQLTEIKELKSDLAEIGFDNWKEAVTEIASENEDFEIDDFRFIHGDNIDDIMQDELSSDSYLLGCFTASFLAGIEGGLSEDIILALQEEEKFEAIGQHYLDNELVGEIQADYARLDGYGHHFARYDGHGHEIYVNTFDEKGVCLGATTWHVFKVN